MTTAQVIQYYKALLILQYRSLGNALATVELWVTEFIQDQIVSQVRDAFDLNTAIGAQLNIIGQYKGISRTLFGLAPGDYWSLVPYADPNPDGYFGWAEYPDSDPTWFTLQYADLSRQAYVLSDFQMRLLIKLKIAFDTWDGTLGNLDNILYSFFGPYVNVVDNGDMEIVYQHEIIDPDTNQLWELATISQILPHPAGVGFTVQEI